MFYKSNFKIILKCKTRNGNKIKQFIQIIAVKIFVDANISNIPSYLDSMCNNVEV